MKKIILAFIAIPILILCGCERKYTTITDPSVLIGTWQSPYNSQWQITFTDNCFYSTNSFRNSLASDPICDPFCATYTIENDSLLDLDYSIGGRMVPCDSIPLVGRSGNGTEYCIKFYGKKLVISSVPQRLSLQDEFTHVFVKSK